MDTSSKPPESGKVVYSAPALERGFSIIELLAEHPSGLLMSEIAAGLELTLGEIFRVVIVMEKRGWIVKNPETDKFKVAPKILQLAFKAIPSEDLAYVAGPIMRQLSLQTGQSCHLVIRNGARGLVILRQESEGPTVFYVRPGADIDLFETCSGHVLLAHLSQGRQIYSGDLAEKMQQRADLHSPLERIRDRGYELMPSVRTRGVTDISCPIFSSEGVVAALTLPFLELIDGSQLVDLNEARSQLIAAAKTISAKLGAA